jgi:23S rRNA A2030 N6-methylase RlmJ
MTDPIKTLLDSVEPDAWGAFYFSGTGKLYSHAPSLEIIRAYINQVHQSNDSITLTEKPIYSRTTVESLLRQQEERHQAELKQARKDALLKAADAYQHNDDDKLMNEYVAEWLRRMAEGSE